MDHGNHLLVFTLLSFLLRGESWGWFSSSKETPSSGKTHAANEGNFSAEFSIESFNDHKGVKLIENAKKKMISSNSCWQNAYQHLFAGCSEILAVDEKRSRLAWHLSDCFQRDSGRSPFPHCDPKSSIVVCSRSLDDLAHKVYLEFYLETNTICYQLQAHAFKYETERLVTELKTSAQYVEHKLDSIEEKSEYLLQGSRQIHDSLDSIGSHTKQVVQTANYLEGHIDSVLTHSRSAYEQTTKIALSQTQLNEGKENMKRNLEDGMDNLKSKAEDIGNMAGISIDKQQQLLEGQSTALEELNSLTEFQSKALEESRKTRQYFAEYGHRQHEELIQRQQQIQGFHDRLMENSREILSSQESFESKQASMFVVFDRIFALQNTLLLESRMIKAFFVYSILIFVIFMLTSTKQTYNIRPFLYIDLYVILFVEVLIIRLTSDNIEHQSSIINIARLFFMVAALIQLLHAIFTYKNYETLNHQMLLTLINKVNSMQKEKELPWDLYTDYEGWSEWIDADLPDDVNCLDDPDHIQEVAENPITVTKNYNLRNRNLFH
ncbi:Protein GAMETE EXPRESSED 1 [Glycine max]|nr:Protein GAMETE EXPRESSED 1 [Glycine max]